jgi:hypothetical protein
MNIVNKEAPKREEEEEKQIPKNNKTKLNMFLFVDCVHKSR